MGHQLLQHRQQPGPVVRQVGIEVLDVVAGRDGAAHRNTPRRPGARAGSFFPMAPCMPEGKNRALTVRRPLEAAAAASRVRGGMGRKEGYPLLPEPIAND